jgi:predicted nucleic acid-binding protein
MDLIADTTFLVGLWRRQPWAMDFARRHPEKSLGLPWIVLGEFWHGALRAGHDAGAVNDFLSIGLPLLDPAPVIPAYAELCARTQSTPGYREIGQNDLWIAAVCLATGKPLISRNRRHFDRIENLRIEVLEGR